MANTPKHCPLCGHFTLLTVHHAIWPRRRYINHPKRDEMTIRICRECHDMVHDYYDQTRYKTRESA